MELLVICTAFIFGMAFRQLKLPPLIGFLVAGFLLYAYGYRSTPALEQVAHLGVLLLLFSIGLKLRFKSLLRPEAWGAGALHMLLIGTVLTLALMVLTDLGWSKAALIAAVLGISSTVLAAKVLEEKQELRAFHGRVTIGILVIQDLVAIALISIVNTSTPSPWALCLFALPLLRPLLHRTLQYMGHDELFLLYGVLLALVVGGWGFTSLGLSGELGALLVGMLLAGHPRAVELSNTLWGLKELFLVGFFIMIGLSGPVTLEALVTALWLTALLPLYTLMFFIILTRFRLRARSAFLAAVSLTTYSEFGLIVADLGQKNGWLAPQWLVSLAIAVALSFAIAAPLNRSAHRIYGLLEPWLRRFEVGRQHPDEQPLRLGRARVLIMGMGRIGSGAYDFFTEHSERVVALDSDPGKVEQHRKHSRRVLYADAEDPQLWLLLDTRNLHAVVLAMPDMEAKLIAVRSLRQNGYAALILATSSYPWETEKLLEAGADHVSNSFYAVGADMASHVYELWELPATSNAERGSAPATPRT